MTEILQTIDDLLEIITKNKLECDLENIKKAYKLAEKSHAGVTRLSGAPYISHPVAVACILANLQMDEDSIIAGLLHDTVEDTDVTLEDIEKAFGKDVSLLVDGVTKIGDVSLKDSATFEQQQSENVRKMLLVMSKDPRCIIVKMADRLHNMRTICFMKPHKQRQKALECMEIFAPIADRIGLRLVKEELEDISIKILDPLGIEDIETRLTAKKDEREIILKSLVEKVKNTINPHFPDCLITSRVKSLVGIYKKFYLQNRPFDDIYDIYAIRVILDNEVDCYGVMGLLLGKFIPIASRTKDYIASPKKNGYRSIHLSLISDESDLINSLNEDSAIKSDISHIVFEVQIRTHDMHKIAEYGIASHWRYKVGLQNDKMANLDNQIDWVRRLLENDEESADVGFIVNSIKQDLTHKNIYVRTPKGDVIELPEGSTVVDFAYAIHSEIGNRMVSCRVDTKHMPINTVLKNGQMVEILRGDKNSSPSRDWLRFCKTSDARSKIRQYFKKEHRDENIEKGKLALSLELKKSNVKLTDIDIMQACKSIVKHNNVKSADDLYASIGYGGIDIHKCLSKIADYLEKNKIAETNVEEKIEQIEAKTQEKITNQNQSKKTCSKSSVLIEGLDSISISIAKCCNPIPPDSIKGFVTRGKGVTIHKADCINIKGKDELLLEASWTENKEGNFLASLIIKGVKGTSFMMDLTSVINKLKINLEALDLKNIDESTTLANCKIFVKNFEELNNFAKNVKSLDSVIDVNRA